MFNFFDLEIDSDDFEDLLPPNANTDIMCCCNKDVPHNEDMKFLLIGNEKNRNATIFTKRSKGELIQLSDLNIKDKISCI